MAALQYVDRPGYAALILRKTFTDLNLPGAVMDRSHAWLDQTDAHWDDQDHQWTFPSGGRLQFGYLDQVNSRYRYQSAEFQFVGFDELTQFPIQDYLYLFTRLRRLVNVDIPIRMRAASNPGGFGHEWVKQRFIPITEVDPLTGRVVTSYPKNEDGSIRTFIPSKLDDNPHVDREEYKKSLALVDPTLRAQMLAGDWNAAAPGSKFNRDWFTVIDHAPRIVKRVRYWDLASTEDTGQNDPDWTVGTRMGLTPTGQIVIEDRVRVRASPAKVEAAVQYAAERDNPEGPPGFPIWIEQEPGSAGKSVISNYQRRVLMGYNVRGHRPTGDKETRADSFAARAEAGDVFLVRGVWIPDWLGELEGFPIGAHDDQVDSAVGAYLMLARGATATSGNYVGKIAESVYRKGDLILKGDRYIDKVLK